MYGMCKQSLFRSLMWGMPGNKAQVESSTLFKACHCMM